jgi:hypothetical protein
MIIHIFSPYFRQGGGPINFSGGGGQQFQLFRHFIAILGFFCYTFCKNVWKTPTFLHLDGNFTRRGVGKMTDEGVGQIAAGGESPDPLKICMLMIESG